MPHRLTHPWRLLRRYFGRSGGLLQLLGLPQAAAAGTSPGLILVQIDGLARRDYERALEAGRLPFLQKLQQRGNYRLRTFYSGLPAATPAVQAELFYGQPAAVPAFEFRDSTLERTVQMYDPTAVNAIEARLAQASDALLAGGSSYSNNYTGGAAEAHFCVPLLDPKRAVRKFRPHLLLAASLVYPLSVLRTIGVTLLETLLALTDAVRGVSTGRSLRKELLFVPQRVGICILLRELIVLGARLDVARGLPIVHLNLLGYDEQAHRRGPQSRFARWVLGGIDGAIRRISCAADRAPREYDLWIYSDHGQEATIQYRDVAGAELRERVRAAYHASQAAPVPAAEAAPADSSGEQLQRFGLLGSAARAVQSLGRQTPSSTTGPDVSAMGPLGHVYLPNASAAKERATLARRLVNDAQVPLVLWLTDDGQVRALNAAGERTLPADAAAVLGPDHPLGEQVAQDLAALCRHPEAGDLVVSGWQPAGKPLSFSYENGAHGGPGPNETRGFALLPDDVPLPDGASAVIRAVDLRAAGFAFRAAQPRPATSAARTPSVDDRLRVVTYNIHGAVGLDGRRSLRRIARVLRAIDADVVALQEVDVQRPRSGEVDQAAELAAQLGMQAWFTPAYEIGDERYGLALLTRLPFEHVRAGYLRPAGDHDDREPRCAQWVTVQLADQRLHVVNTHLSLGLRERRTELGTLLGPDWLTPARCQEPLILLGDLNSTPRSSVYAALACRLQDAQLAGNRRPQRTWFGRFPIRRIDHVFCSAALRVCDVRVPSGATDYLASDHRPVVAEVALDPVRRQDASSAGESVPATHRVEAGA